MRLPKFEYFEPGDIKAAVSFLQNEPAAKILAGGTDLLINMKHRVELPAAIVNIKGLDGLSYIRQDNGSLCIGGLTTLKQIYHTLLIAEKLPGLAQASAAVGSYHHQTMGTLGGNICQQNRCKFFNQSRWWRRSRPTCFKAGGEICHVVNKKEICYSSYCGDVAPALIVLNARIALTGPDGSREILLEDLFSGDGKKPLNLGAAEVITEIIIPREAMEGVGSYAKFANRESIDFPIVGAAYWGSLENKQYRVAFTAVDRRPVRGYRAEAALNGQDLSEDNLDAACEVAAEEAKPLKTSVYSPSYKRRMMGLLLKDAVGRTERRGA
ncbi:MAG: FAD binding domain-containing protein [Deltaproteobacteria bacterium]|nr:FAD binding domain-containing protein [Deltaproteobacteria bacterium]